LRFRKVERSGGRPFVQGYRVSRSLGLLGSRLGPEGGRSTPLPPGPAFLCFWPVGPPRFRAGFRRAGPGRARPRGCRRLHLKRFVQGPFSGKKRPLPSSVDESRPAPPVKGFGPRAQRHNVKKRPGGVPRPFRRRPPEKGDRPFTPDLGPGPEIRGFRHGPFSGPFGRPPEREWP